MVPVFSQELPASVSSFFDVVQHAVLFYMKIKRAQYEVTQYACCFLRTHWIRATSCHHTFYISLLVVSWLLTSSPNSCTPTDFWVDVFCRKSNLILTCHSVTLKHLNLSSTTPHDNWYRILTSANWTYFLSFIGRLKLTQIILISLLWLKIATLEVHCTSKEISANRCFSQINTTSKRKLFICDLEHWSSC